MSILIIAFIALALVHFIYESIIAPSVRLRLRYECFALRDELRRIHCDDDSVSDEAFDVLQESLNTQIRVMARITPDAVVRSERAFRAHEKLRNDVERRKAVMNSCASDEFISVRRKSAMMFSFTLLTNSAMLVLYLAPFFGLAVSVSWFRDKLRGIVASTERVVFLPERRVESLLPTAA